MLGAGAGDADGVGLLKGVVADHEGRHLTGQNDQRDRIHQRIRDARDRVRGPGPRRDQNDTGFAGRAGITLGGMHGALFVTHQDVANVVLLKDLVINR